MATKATKMKTVKVRVAVIYDEKGRYQAGGYWTLGGRHSDGNLITDAREAAPTAIQDVPLACLVDIELPIPKPTVGKVVKVKAVKT